MALPADGIKGALLLLGIDAIEQRATLVIDPVVKNLLETTHKRAPPARRHEFWWTTFCLATEIQI